MRGRFRGRMNGAGDGGGSPVFRQVWRLLSDPDAPVLPKIVFYAAFVYVLLPLDVVPGFRIPVLGWLDDVLVAALAWSLVKHDLERYRRL